MRSGVSAAVTAMEQAVRRLDAALAQRAAAFRRLGEQHGAMAAELKAVRDELQAVKAEADSLRERAALVDALREELAQMQSEGAADGNAGNGNTGGAQAEIAALKRERDELRRQLAARVAMPVVPTNGNGTAAEETTNGGVTPGEVAALKAELAAAHAAQAEMQAFQSGIAARLEATMARLRQVLDADVVR